MIEQHGLKTQHDDISHAICPGQTVREPAHKVSIQSFESWASSDLYDRAQELQVEGYAFMTRTELTAVLSRNF